MDSRHHLWGRILTGTACLVLASIGCTRSSYRRQADHDVSHLLDEKGWNVAHYPLQRGPESRLFDPYDPDYPPMPPDDPVSHQLMHRVDGKRGYKHWDRNGFAPTVDSGTWPAFLPLDESGTAVLDYRGAVEVGLTNSRRFQRELENLYISALNVSFERFRFDVQFFSGNDTTFTADGRDRPGSLGRSTSTLETVTDARLRRLTATGGEIVVGLANTLIWQFSGPDSSSARSLLDFSIVQPLLRFGGRARVLESLTLSERNLLANVRQMEQFRQGFFVNIATGRNATRGLLPSGPVGISGLGLLAGIPSGRTGAPDAGGFLGLLQDQQQIRNQAANVVALRDSLAQLDAAFEAGRIGSSLQVDQTRQALYNAQSDLLSDTAAYQTRLDRFKILLGLPPRFPVQIQDSLIDRFNLLDPSLTQLQDQIGSILDVIRVRGRIVTTADLLSSFSELVKLREPLRRQLEITDRDLSTLVDDLPLRIERLAEVRSSAQSQRADVDPNIFDEDALKGRIVRLQQRLPRMRQAVAANWQHIDALPSTLSEDSLEDTRKQLVRLATQLSGLMLELSLDQASARLESIALIPIDVESDTAFQIAQAQRLDLMNARARLVDVWRLIEFDANALKSDLDVMVNGDIATVDDNPVKFDSRTGRLQVGVAFDTPTTRLAERNTYREALIEYQRARRDYTLFEDEISASIRNTLRIIELLQVNFEIRRAAVEVAISQVDVARLKLNQPPRPGQPGQFGATTARDLVSALSDLLDAQNDFLDVWISYEILRVLLDFELGTMRLDEDGVWIDPGPTDNMSKPSAMTDDSPRRLPPT